LPEPSWRKSTRSRWSIADYWDKEGIHIHKVIYRPIQDSTVRLADLQSGNLDIIERLLATDIATVRGDPKLKLVTRVSLGYTGLTINLANTDQAKNPLGLNAKFRQALELSIDRDAINQTVFNGEFTPGNRWSSPKNPYYIDNFPIPGRNIEKAKALLKDGSVQLPIKIDLMVPNGPDTRQVAEVIQAMAAEAGFDLNLRVTEFATSLSEGCSRSVFVAKPALNLGSLPLDDLHRRKVSVFAQSGLSFDSKAHAQHHGRPS
jgi:peptide/nickel transport system substrate-binding protein